MKNMMSKKLFADKEIKILLKNPYVKTVSDKAITYTDEFKQIFVIEKDKGMFPQEIFAQCGFDLEILGKERIASASKRWMRSFAKQGMTGLNDKRKEQSGRPRINEMTPEEKISRLEAQNLLLKAENELLKNIELEERRLRKEK